MSAATAQIGTAYSDAVQAIALRLCRTAVWDGARCYQAGLRPEALPGGFRHSVQPLGADLYTGSAGTLLFLSLAHQCGFSDPEILRTMNGTAEHVLASWLEIDMALRLGFYTGWTGMAFALIDAGEGTQSDRWVNAGLDGLRRLARRSPSTMAPDALTGAAGAIPALLHVHARYPSRPLIHFAERLGQHILASARKRDIGWSWPAVGPLSHLHRDDLTGFAHGASGYAWALLELFAWTGNRDYLHGATEALRYERHWFRPEMDNWLDVRYMPGTDGNVNDGKTCQIQWCYGSAGAGLVRLRAFELTGEAIYREEAEAALRATATDMERYPHNWQPNFSLCHGVAGNADLFIEASLRLREPGWFKTAAAAGDMGLDLYHRTGAPWPGAIAQTEIPGLMTGLAGTGLFYLRLLDPVAVPSILAVSVPNTARV